VLRGLHSLQGSVECVLRVAFLPWAVRLCQKPCNVGESTPGPSDVCRARYPLSYATPPGVEPRLCLLMAPRRAGLPSFRWQCSAESARRGRCSGSRAPSCLCRAVSCQGLAYLLPLLPRPVRVTACLHVLCECVSLFQGLENM